VTDNEEGTVSILNLFLIGLCAGFIATILPRFAPYISQVNNDVSIEFFTLKFFVVAGVFSLMIGVSMIWIYKGTKEHTKTLFLSALALPAVLSGALNTSNISSISDQKLGELDNQVRILQDKLEDQHSIEFIDFNTKIIQSMPLSFFQGILGISNAYASGGDVLNGNNTENQSIVVKANTLDKTFVLMYGESDNKSEIKNKIRELKSKNITNLAPYTIGDKIYLLKNERVTKTNALIEAISVKEKYGITPKIINLK